MFPVWTHETKSADWPTSSFHRHPRTNQRAGFLCCPLALFCLRRVQIVWSFWRHKPTLLSNNLPPHRPPPLRTLGTFHLIHSHRFNTGDGGDGDFFLFRLQLPTASAVKNFVKVKRCCFQNKSMFMCFSTCEMWFNTSSCLWGQIRADCPLLGQSRNYSVIQTLSNSRGGGQTWSDVWSVCVVTEGGRAWRWSRSCSEFWTRGNEIRWWNRGNRKKKLGGRFLLWRPSCWRDTRNWRR